MGPGDYVLVLPGTTSLDGRIGVVVRVLALQPSPQHGGRHTPQMLAVRLNIGDEGLDPAECFDVAFEPHMLKKLDPNNEQDAVVIAASLLTGGEATK